MASFRGLYDKLVSFVFDSNKDDDYNPVVTDYVAVFDSEGPRNNDATATWMPKKYVPVTTIGTGGGGGGSMSSFQAEGSGVIEVSLDGSSYGSGPVTVENGDTLYVQAISTPSGLNWQGPFNNSNNYSANDVVSWVDPSTNIYYTYWATTSIISGGGNPNLNPDWALLGSQGPAGATGATGPTGAAATQNFRIVNNASATVLANNAGPNADNPTTNNDRGGFIYMANANSTTTVTIPENLSTNATTGFPLLYQTSVIKAGAGGSVQIIPANSNVTINSADGANYLRTQFSSCTLIRKAQNEWVMFGDLTNIA